MKKIKFGIGFCCLLALITLVKISSAQSAPTDVTALTQQLTSLRAELLQQGIDFQEYKIKQLGRELQRLKIERELLEASEQNVRRQLAAVEQSLASEASSEQEGMKAELNGTHLQGVRNKTQPLMEQETELLRQLAQEQEQLQVLQTKLKRLKIESGVEPRR